MLIFKDKIKDFFVFRMILIKIADPKLFNDKL